MKEAYSCLSSVAVRFNPMLGDLGQADPGTEEETMRWGIRRLPVSRAALLRLLGAMAVLVLVWSSGSRLSAREVICDLDSVGCYGAGCRPNPEVNPGYNFTYSIFNWHCRDTEEERNNDWYEAEFTGCCLYA